MINRKLYGILTTYLVLNLIPGKLEAEITSTTTLNITKELENFLKNSENKS